MNTKTKLQTRALIRIFSLVCKASIRITLRYLLREILQNALESLIS